jgi:hypothetical protein
MTCKGMLTVVMSTTVVAHELWMLNVTGQGRAGAGAVLAALPTHKIAETSMKKADVGV